MKCIVILLFLLFALTSCHNVHEERMSGTELTTDANGRRELVTYVSQEEFERMSPAERQRLHASVGASVSVPWGGSNGRRDPLSQEKLDKAMKGAAE